MISFSSFRRRLCVFFFHHILFVCVFVSFRKRHFISVLFCARDVLFILLVQAHRVDLTPHSVDVQTSDRMYACTRSFSVFYSVFFRSYTHSIFFFYTSFIRHTYIPPHAIFKTTTIRQRMLL